jgi:hypothetical protein
MAAKKAPRFRLVFHRSSLLTKTVVLTTLAVTTAVLLILTLSIRSAKSAEAESRAKAAQLERENAELSENIQQSGSVENHKDH